MADEDHSRPELRRRWPRRVAAGVAVLLLLGLAGTAGAGWYFSSLLLTPDHAPGPYDERIVGLTGNRATFERTEQSARPGVYGLDWPGDGTAVVSEILASTGKTVTRRVSEVRGNVPAKSAIEFRTPVDYEGNPWTALRVPFRSVPVETKLGPMREWLIGGRSDTWVIYVHGYQSAPAAGLRDVGNVRAFGMPMLLVRYRNDVGAPRAPGGLIHLGMTEWEDVDSAARFAVARGASRFIVFGDSMGGAVVSQFMHESKLAARVRALVLDAPVLDWRAVIELQSRERSLPFFIEDAAEIAVRARIGIDWGAFDQIKRAKDFRVPILLFHGEQDNVVPFSTSRDFARALPRLVTFFPNREAGHVQSWNVNPRLYDRRVRTFLSRFVSPAP